MKRNRALTSLATTSLWLFATLALGCGRPASVPGPTTPAPSQVASDAPTNLLSRPLAGDVYWVSGGDDDVRAVFLEIEAMPQPEGDVIGSIELHHAFRVLRLVDEVPAPATVDIVDQTNLCEAEVTRARRVHTLFVGEDDPETPPNDPRTYLVLDFEGCDDGTAGISGVPRADIRVRSLRREDLTQPASSALVAAVRPGDDGIWGGEPLPTADFRMLELPAHGVTFVVGTVSWVVRDGVVLSGAEPITLIEAGPLVLLELETPSETWLGSLADFSAPTRP